MKECEKILKYFKYSAATGEEYEQEPEAGWLAYSDRQGENGIQRIGEWYHCRESFHIHFNDNSRRPNQFLFYVGKFELAHKVVQFIEEMENRLKIKEKTQILGFKNCSTVVSIQFSKWWKENEARFQLFTILLRAGLYFNRSFDRALWDYEYIDLTKDAVKKFFDGYTHCELSTLKGNKGWVYHFCQRNWTTEQFELKLAQLTKP